jgi:hypothetical protein
MFGETMMRMKNFRMRMRERRNRAATYLAITQLPPHIRKDIGWPNAYDRRSGRLDG